MYWHRNVIHYWGQEKLAKLSDQPTIPYYYAHLPMTAMTAAPA